SVTLLDAIAEFRFDACIGGARRDEEKARAKERIFSFRDEFGQWDPKNQRPELWDIYNTRVHPGENIRVFPISNWTELDVWEYIAREALEVPHIYFAHTREVIKRGNGLLPVSRLVQLQEGEQAENLMVRFRTVGNMSCTCPVQSTGQVQLISPTVRKRTMRFSACSPSWSCTRRDTGKRPLPRLITSRVWAK